jgi:hypothetical protein
MMEEMPGQQLNRCFNRIHLVGSPDKLMVSPEFVPVEFGLTIVTSAGEGTSP